MDERRLTARQLRRSEGYLEAPVTALRSIAEIRRRLNELEPLAVARARERGFTWEELAEAMGVTRQALHQRYRQRARRSNEAA